MNMLYILIIILIALLIIVYITSLFALSPNTFHNLLYFDISLIATNIIIFFA